MRLRIAFAGLAALAVSPVLAQQTPVAPIPASPQPTETRPNQPLGTNAPQREQRTRQGGAPQDTGSQARQGRGSTAGPGPQQAEAARAVQDLLAAGTVALQTSIFARDKAQNPHAKQFARFEEDEQNTLADVLHGLAAPDTTASTGAAQAAATAPELPPQSSDTMERLARTQAGAEFDRAYVAAQIQAHRDLQGVADRLLQAPQPDPELAAIARLAASRVREHLARLQDLEQELGR